MYLSTTVPLGMSLYVPEYHGPRGYVPLGHREPALILRELYRHIPDNI